MSTADFARTTRLTAPFASGLKRWSVPLTLAVPFLIGIAALRGLTVGLPTFHAVDEYLFHYPVILRFAHQLPFPDLARYPAAQTPLFHLLMAYGGKVIGYELWRLRLLEVLISYAAALVLFVLLERRVGLDRFTALVLALLFALSPYVYAISFRLLTDNLAILFSLLALERFERFREAERIGPFLVGCLSVAAAVLTRQSTAFLVGVAGLYALRGGLARRGWLAVRQGALAIAAAGASIAPAGALFLLWHGFVPPGGDPASCSLCSGGSAGSGAGSHLVVQSTELALATIGLYGAVLFAPLLLRGIPRIGWPISPELRGPLAGAGLGALLLVLSPAHTSHGEGFIWHTARHLPSLLGSSLLFWALVPIAGAVLWARLRVAPRPWLAVVFLGCFLVSTLVIRLPWQKYVDPFALLGIFLTVRKHELVTPRDFAGAGILAIAFVAYTLSFIGSP
jgi:4-amino-4-deoxy-L-arabinose transferase-like glycosyltransferase